MFNSVQNLFLICEIFLKYDPNVKWVIEYDENVTFNYMGRISDEDTQRLNVLGCFLDFSWYIE